jgi:hypothetical protein
MYLVTRSTCVDAGSREIWWPPLHVPRHLPLSIRIEFSAEPAASSGYIEEEISTNLGRIGRLNISGGSCHFNNMTRFPRPQEKGLAYHQLLATHRAKG